MIKLPMAISIITLIAGYLLVVPWIFTLDVAEAEQPAAASSPGGDNKVAPLQDKNEPKLTALTIADKELELAKGKNHSLKATAVYSDGTRRDVTAMSSFRSSDELVGTIDPSTSKLTAVDFGESIIVAAYMRHSAVLRLLVPQPLDKPFPKVKSKGKIDQLVHAKLKRLGFPPSDVCADHEFLRRVYLDVIGTLPTSAEARSFIENTDKAKRSKLIDALLARPEFADFWTLKWGDILRVKSEHPSKLWPNGVQAYNVWIRDSIVTNKPADQFARELLTCYGSNFRQPETNFFRAVPERTPSAFGEAAAVVFMGTRIGCARCKNHLSDTWDHSDSLGLGAFFAKIAFKRTLEWKEEIVYFNPKGQLLHPETSKPIKPKFPGGATIDVNRYEDPRVQFADWLTAPKNPWFSRNIANRIWYWLMGRGIVHEPDDMRMTNPPENPQLLDYLAGELASHDFDMKHIFRLVLNSQTYQRSSRTTPGNEKDRTHFSRYIIRRLQAEVLLDAICQVTGTTERFASMTPEPFTEIPPGHRAIQVSDGSMSKPFLDLFGRPARSVPFESERSEELSIWQVLYLLSSKELEDKVSRITNTEYVSKLIKKGKKSPEILDEIYLATLSRFPSKKEKQILLKIVPDNPSDRAGRLALQDVLWAILNSKEFLLNH